MESGLKVRIVRGWQRRGTCRRPSLLFQDGLHTRKLHFAALCSEVPGPEQYYFSVEKIKQDQII
ncbi:hypothetical protein P154DRAFT_1328 [Amniculicola lignicola CBS 123094]|uniref:YDG domain-containing protein n=1 Tax=Amniculicola lignicola CBS 123094 TaxID=1392246 RepID=A0A6A5X4A1_9PLEO|nr:hypothetical protein P154DRAFT_1328 [Amniculicola lignicola CBS 123094]